MTDATAYVTDEDLDYFVLTDKLRIFDDFLDGVDDPEELESARDKLAAGFEAAAGERRRLAVESDDGNLLRYAEDELILARKLRNRQPFTLSDSPFQVFADPWVERFGDDPPNREGRECPR